MDLTKFSLERHADEGAELKLRHPVTKEIIDEDGKTPTIRLIGSDSKTYQKFIQARVKTRLKKAAGTDDSLEKTALERALDFEGNLKEEAELLSVCTVSWENIEENGTAVSFSSEAAQRIYVEYPWIREQVSKFITTRANFFRS